MGANTLPIEKHFQCENHQWNQLSSASCKVPKLLQYPNVRKRHLHPYTLKANDFFCMYTAYSLPTRSFQRAHEIVLDISSSYCDCAWFQTSQETNMTHVQLRGARNLYFLFRFVSTFRLPISPSSAGKQTTQISRCFVRSFCNVLCAAYFLCMAPLLRQAYLPKLFDFPYFDFLIFTIHFFITKNVSTIHCDSSAGHKVRTSAPNHYIWKRYFVMKPQLPGNMYCPISVCHFQCV